MIYDPKRLQVLSGLPSGEKESLVEDKRKFRNKEGEGRARLFTPHVDDQEASMNAVGIFLDKVDFLNVADRLWGMPRFGFKKGNAKPYDKLARGTIKALPDEIHADPETAAAFNSMSQEDADLLGDLLNGAGREGTDGEPRRQLFLRALKQARIRAGKLPEDVIGEVELTNDKKYMYYIVDDGAHFYAGDKRTRRVLSRTKYPIKLGSPVASAAKALASDATSAEDFLAILNQKMKFDGDIDAFANGPGVDIFEKKTIDKSLTRWAMDRYASVIDQFIEDSKSSKERSIRVGKTKMSASIYISDLIAYLNSSKITGEDGDADKALARGKELWVPKVDNLGDVQQEVHKLTGLLLSRKITLSDLVSEATSLTDFLDQLEASSIATDDEDLKKMVQKGEKVQTPSADADDDTEAEVPDLAAHITDKTEGNAFRAWALKKDPDLGEGSASDRLDQEGNITSGAFKSAWAALGAEYVASLTDDQADDQSDTDIITKIRADLGQAPQGKSAGDSHATIKNVILNDDGKWDPAKCYEWDVAAYNQDGSIAVKPVDDASCEEDEPGPEEEASPAEAVTSPSTPEEKLKADPGWMDDTLYLCGGEVIAFEYDDAKFETTIELKFGSNPQKPTEPHDMAATATAFVNYINSIDNFTDIYYLADVGPVKGGQGETTEVDEHILIEIDLDGVTPASDDLTSQGGTYKKFGPGGKIWLHQDEDDSDIYNISILFPMTYELADASKSLESDDFTVSVVDATDGKFKIVLGLTSEGLTKAKIATESVLYERWMKLSGIL